MTADFTELTAYGKRIEVKAVFDNTRSYFDLLYNKLDPNLPEADELARLITELRGARERLDKAS